MQWNPSKMGTIGEVTSDHHRVVTFYNIVNLTNN